MTFRQPETSSRCVQDSYQIPAAIRFADANGTSIAYEVISDGDVDLVVTDGMTTHLEILHADANGCDGLPTVRPAGNQRGRCARCLFRRHPARAGFEAGDVGRHCDWASGPGTALGNPAPLAFAMLRTSLERWGEGLTIDLTAPSHASSNTQRRMWGTFERLLAGPGMMRALARSLEELDVSSILPSVAVPTLVIGRTDDALVPIEQTRYIAESIPNAELHESAGPDLLCWLGPVDCSMRA